MEGESRKILTSVSSSICPLGILPIDRYSFGLLLQVQASATAGNRKVPTADINCKRRIMSGYCMISDWKPYTI